MVTVSHRKQFKDLKIYIDGLIHVHFFWENYIGFQSWTDGSKANQYHIEIYFANDQQILLEYDNIKIWEDILKIFDGCL